MLRRLHPFALTRRDVVERNPAELGIMEREIKRVKQGRYVLIPTGPETRGHGTMGIAKLWKQHLAEFVQPPVQASK